jgi:O-antigen/teichoic acid export membrane protein
LDGKWVLIIYSAGILVSTVIGLAGNITEISRHFRYNTLFLALSVGLQFVLSFVLIPRYGIVGAALATMITLVLNALLQVALQRIAYGISGVSFRLLWVAGIGIVSFGVGQLLPQMPLIADIVVRSALVSLVFGGIILKFNVSEEINETVQAVFQSIRIWFKR